MGKKKLEFQMTNTTIIDGKGHLEGRLASIVAKHLLTGHDIVVVRCEQILISGGLLRQKMKYKLFLDKYHNSNPKRCGPIHYRSPSRIFWRTVRGMTPHKTVRGTSALSRLKCYEGVPSPYDKIKLMLVPDALTVLRKARRKNEVKLGQLSSSVGWKHFDAVDELEAKRKERGAKYYAQLNSRKEISV